jgi:putative transposase
MPRDRRIVVTGCAHHITQRGNHREVIFTSDEDRRTYLRYLRESATRTHVSLLGFALMSNHVHWIATPPEENALAETFGRTHYRYSHYFQASRQLTGHLWQGRFRSFALGPDHLVRALLYIELNPVRAGLVRSAIEYRWSSARAHVTGHDEWQMLDLDAWSGICRAGEWLELLQAGEKR